MIVVLGIGNLLMGDDAIGVRITEALSRDQTFRRIRFVAGETDIDYCLRELEDADICILIDAACMGSDPGAVKVLDLKRAFEEKRRAQYFHDFDLIHAMKIRNMIRDGLLITVEVCSVSFSAELSPLLRERFEEIVREVKVIITSYLLGS